jgi:hypothetical protein
MLGMGEALGRFMRTRGRAAAGLCEFAEVEGGLVAVGEADDHASSTWVSSAA